MTLVKRKWFIALLICLVLTIALVAYGLSTAFAAGSDNKVSFSSPPAGTVGNCACYAGPPGQDNAGHICYFCCPPGGQCLTGKR